MLEYLVILLDDMSASYCCANNPAAVPGLMPIDVLQESIIYGMKENLMINYVLPSFPLPEEYLAILEKIDNVKIGQDISIVENVSHIEGKKTVILRVKIKDFCHYASEIADSLRNVSRLNVCFTDTDQFADEDIPQYKESLKIIAAKIFQLYESGETPCFNLLTDRLTQTAMVNCGAGISNITVAPNGKFYLCPAFYYDELKNLDNLMNHRSPSSSRSVGDLHSGLKIDNRELLNLDHAPICRICDAFQCHRCVWLNQKLTGDVNTPSHQQCVMSHVERNVSRDLQCLIHNKIGAKITIPEIDYLDPFEIVVRK